MKIPCGELVETREFLINPVNNTAEWFIKLTCPCGFSGTVSDSLWPLTRCQMDNICAAFEAVHDNLECAIQERIGVKL